MSWDRFARQRVETRNGSIAVSVAGSGPGLLLLHGFPQTREMWREVAPLLAEDFYVVCADLPGYGESGCPPSGPDHAAYSKRAIGAEMVAAMEELGFEEFGIVGHDRGARVAYRAALDHPRRVRGLVALDVIPIDSAWRLADDRLALGFWPWSLLAQPAPLPERLLLGAPEAVIDAALANWGTPPDTFPPKVRQAYAAQLRDPERVTAICEEYRAAAEFDRVHDAEDRAAGNRIRCPALVLWSASGPLGSWYEEEGGPLALWDGLCDQVEGEPVEGGHFFPEERPKQVAARLGDFLRGLNPSAESSGRT